MNKNVIIIAVVAVVAIAAVAAFLALGNGDKNDNGGGGDKPVVDDYDLYITPSSGTAKVLEAPSKLLVFGNANNDCYLDSSDISFIQSIVDGKSSWSKSQNPYADTNADGKVISDDVSLLKRFLNGEKASMFYNNSFLETMKVKFPLTGKVCFTGTNDADLFRLINKESVLHATRDTVVGNPNYAGSDKWVSIGKTPYDYETVVQSGCNIVIGQPYSFDETFLRLAEQGEKNYHLDIIRLCCARYINEIDGTACALTLGALFNSLKDQKYKDYADYISTADEIVKQVNDGATEKKTWIINYIGHGTKSSAELAIDNLSDNEINYADVGTLCNFKNMAPAYPVKSGDGYYEGLTVEDLISCNPDVIIIEADRANLSEIKENVNTVADWYRNAGFKGVIIGTCFSVMGDSASVSLLPLLSHFIYGESAYPLEDAYRVLMDYYNKFLGGSYTMETIKDSWMTPFYVA